MFLLQSKTFELEVFIGAYINFLRPAEILQITAASMSFFLRTQPNESRSVVLSEIADQLWS